MRYAILLGICACGLAAAADPAYAGKWKMNPAKSNFGESTLTYEQLPGGQFKAAMDGQTYTFKTDGSDAPTPWGSTMAWKTVDAKSWDVTEKISGKVSMSGTAKLSADGKTLTMAGKRAKPDGGTTNETVNLDRVSGGPGLAGKWKTKNLTSSSPETMVVTVKGADGILIAMSGESTGCDAKFDGKDYPMKSAFTPPGWTCQVAKSGTNALTFTWKKDGKEMYKTTLTASADGKTLTEKGSAASVNEPFTMVYDRQ